MGQSLDEVRDNVTITRDGDTLVVEGVAIENAIRGLPEKMVRHYNWSVVAYADPYAEVAKAESKAVKK